MPVGVTAQPGHVDATQAGNQVANDLCLAGHDPLQLPPTLPFNLRGGQKSGEIVRAGGQQEPVVRPYRVCNYSVGPLVIDSRNELAVTRQ